MRLEESERRKYARKLREVYGERIVDPSDLNPESQGRIEVLRHRLNSRFAPAIQAPDLYPQRILLEATQHCTSRCPHCWVHASPESDCRLNVGDMNAIHQNLRDPSRPEPVWTVSGGEFFAMPDFEAILGKFPIQCVYTNAFWGSQDRTCRHYVEKIKQALCRNQDIDKKRFSIIISFDRFHAEGATERLRLSKAVATSIRMIDEILPEASIRISHAVSHPEEDDPEDVFHELRNHGFRIEKTSRIERNSGVLTFSFAYSKGKTASRELFVDRFPVTPIGRGIFLYEPRPENQGGDASEDGTEKLFSDDSRPFHQYTIGPDGGVGLYEILYSPPVPFRLGNLIQESWGTVEKRILHDPIAMAVKTGGLAAVIRFMKEYDLELMKRMIPTLRTVQQFLFLVLLDPTRRLLLNLHLLHEMQGETMTDRPGSEQRETIGRILRHRDSDQRREVFSLYGADRCPD
jgi:hypothetical protein